MSKIKEVTDMTKLDQNEIPHGCYLDFQHVGSTEEISRDGLQSNHPFYWCCDDISKHML